MADERGSAGDAGGAVGAVVKTFSSLVDLMKSLAPSPRDHPLYALVAFCFVGILLMALASLTILLQSGPQMAGTIGGPVVALDVVVGGFAGVMIWLLVRSRQTDAAPAVPVAAAPEPPTSGEVAAGWWSAEPPLTDHEHQQRFQVTAVRGQVLTRVDAALGDRQVREVLDLRGVYGMGKTNLIAWIYLHLRQR